MTGETVGSVSELWRFPVKSMGGERLDQVQVESGGLTGDRGLGVIDQETGQVASAKDVRRFPDLFRFQARLEGDVVWIELPDGSSVRSDAPDVDQVLSRAFGREVSLRAASMPSSREEQPGALYLEQGGIAVPDPVAAFVDCYGMSVLTRSTLDELNRIRPESRFDARRFRMNVIVDTEGSGFPENEWVGRELRLGESARLRIDLPDARCVMTTLAQGELPADPQIMRTLAESNSLEIGNMGKKPCAGVYASVVAPGPVRRGDAVVLV